MCHGNSWRTPNELWTLNTRQPANTLCQLVIDIKVYTPLMHLGKRFSDETADKTWKSGLKSINKPTDKMEAVIYSLSLTLYLSFVWIISLPHSTAFNKAEGREGRSWFLRFKIIFRNLPACGALKICLSVRVVTQSTRILINPISVTKLLKMLKIVSLFCWL